MSLQSFSNYDEAIDWLFHQYQSFQRVGATAYKPGLHTASTLDELYGHPHSRFPTIHVGGTNGKGSTSHTIAAVLQAAGLKVGLFTSPHLVDFRERIRVNGVMISREAVLDFIHSLNDFMAQGLLQDIQPSFFEMTTAMAFDYFARQKVDVAVIEVGLGGRLDSTNIITPELSLITNISPDHTALLGNTLPEIAAEKAGIIKPGVPVVISEALPSTRSVFEAKAAEVGAPIFFAQDTPVIGSYERSLPSGYIYHDTPFGTVEGELGGKCQPLNAKGILLALDILRSRGWDITPEAVNHGFSHVTDLTSLMGRWQTLSTTPLTIADTGHNIGGWEHLAPQIATLPAPRHLVIGFVSDKDVTAVLRLIATIPDTRLYFTQASVERAMSANTLAQIARTLGLQGEVYPHVADAIKAACATTPGSVFIGGSTFVVADALKALN